VLYLRPDVRFSSLLDPTFLYLYNPDLHKSLEAFNSGLAPDPFSLLRQQFKADYVLTRTPAVISALDHDPHMVRKFPQSYKDAISDQAGMFLYAVGKDVRPEYVSTYQYKLHDLGSPPRPWPERPEDLGTLAPIWPEKDAFKDLAYPPRYFDVRMASGQPILPPNSQASDPSLGTVAPMEAELHSQGSSAPLQAIDASIKQVKRDSNGPLCATVQIPVQEMARLAGATVLGVGGGPQIRVFRNGRLIGGLGHGDALFHTTGKMLVLDTPVAASDRIQALLCAEGHQSLGVSLSLWQQTHLASLCDVKRVEVVRQEWSQSLKTTSEWAALECLGPVVRSL
jgi:hypothetical protein